MDNGASSYRRYLDGDETAFDEIMKTYFDNLIFFIDRYVRDTAAAEDIAIDVFSDLIVHKNRYNFKFTLKTYLFMLARSRALNYIKRRNRFSMVDISHAEGEAAERLSLEEHIIADERKAALSKALDGLGDDMRAAIHLIYFEELSYDEAAKVMKKNRKQIDNLLYRAKASLRAILSKDGEWIL